ncbi:hypothetical protein B0F90DRAFT_1736642 [Multifurca ochricompacta]|uniref:RING-type domain-containing protein n=1 Tax=Multifurca ochricompacta TaxID=376703 RepID=A0AAD4QKU9_9AGAM|nr:hypothetical protein B0F90DRAFT_1736642 [Multifurca ochricompacta]
MPAHRYPSATRSHGSRAQGPPKAPIIVISSDEEDKPKSAPKRTSRKSRRSKPEEILEILDDKSLKREETETDNMQQRYRELEQERDRLQRENRGLSSAVAQLKASTRQTTLSISALDDAICCEICTHTMWSPYFLTNCGHTFCQGCLTDWFNTTLSQQIQLSARASPAFTCPSCRHPARTPPVQNFSLKRIVRLVAESRGESSPRRPPPPPPPVLPPSRGRGGTRRDFPPGPFDAFFGR